MSPLQEAFVRSWPDCPGLIVTLLLCGGIYLLGWLRLRHREPWRWRWRQVISFWSGLATIFVALGSPIEAFTSLLFSVHMLQHVLLMMVAPPLVWLGAPLLPLLLGLPKLLRQWLLSFAEVSQLRLLCAWLAHPVRSLVGLVATTWLWHVPVMYELAIRSNTWHYVEHACFLGSALLFWHSVIRPFPIRPRWSRWLLIPALLVADVQNTILSAIFAFADSVLYPHFLEVPRLNDWSALEDQRAAGVLMWMTGSMAFLMPLFGIGTRLFFANDARETIRVPQDRRRRVRSSGGSPRGVALGTRAVQGGRGFDLLRAPIIGQFLSWRHARTSLQSALLVLAVLVVIDGFWGPRLGPMNLAGVLPWIHWRGFVVFGLVVAGNVSCMACPFTLPRHFARRWLPAGRTWPRALRGKWLAVVLVVVFLWAYESLALWSSPGWTAAIIVGYFAAAFVVDGLFAPATFCKYVCPIGQFNFVQSLVSPWQVKTREPAVCGSCRTKDCIRGDATSPGCEMQLFQPRKRGNLDCTFCLACVQACPSDNVGVFAAVPGLEVLHDLPRSGIGRLSRRFDLAALAVVLVIGAFINAAGMTAPVLAFEDRIAQATGTSGHFLISTLFTLGSLLLAPAVLIAPAALLSQRWGGAADSFFERTNRFVFALVPLSLGMWLAHYSFHFLASPAAFIGPTQRFAEDFAGGVLGTPEWARSCCVATAPWLVPWEVVCLAAGLLLSLHCGYRISVTTRPSLREGVWSFLPWALLMALMYGVGVWIVLQPMEMRGVAELTG